MADQKKEVNWEDRAKAAQTIMKVLDQMGAERADRLSVLYGAIALSVPGYSVDLSIRYFRQGPMNLG